MSKSKSKPKAVDPHAPVYIKTMSPLKRWTLVGVAVFCLLIFSVTGVMTTVLSGWFGAGPLVQATLELPSGPAKITLEDQQRATRLREWGEQFLQIFLFPVDGDEPESNLAYATLMKLADDMGLVVTADQIRGTLQGLAAQGAAAYEQRYRNLGFRTAVQFEAQVAAVLRVRTVVELLSASAVPSEADILAAWAKDYEEMDVQFTVWHPSAFADAAAQLEPSEEELQTFFDEGLTGIQRADLEHEQAVSFDAVLLTMESLETDAVKAWFQPEEPVQEALDGFYNSNRFSLYRRPEPEEGVEPDPAAGPYLSIEELGARLRADYLLHKAITTLALELPQAEDAAVFAADKGADYHQQEELVGYSELPELEQVGHLQLRRLFNAELDFWVQTPVQGEGLVYLARPLQRRDRSMPQLSEIRDPVVTLWRENQQVDLAKQAADAFLDGLPRGEDHVEGDSVVLDAEDFASLVAAAAQPLEQMGWLSHTLRRTTDPVWPTEATVLRRLRSVVGNQLQELVDGQVVGPEDYGEDGIVVAHLKGRRAADPDSMWPSERITAERRAQITASQRFYSEMISFEGLSRAYGLTKVINFDSQ